jgi:hypothetical protein
MTLGWIDFSTQDRQRIEAALNRLTPRGTLDELGLGQIRDGLANELFPGTSTLHTRSIYFLLVPELLREIAARPGKRGPREIVQYLHDQEYEAMKHLLQNEGGAWGIIGKSAGKKLKQKPSGAYWSSIKQYGLLDNYGSLRQFVSRCLPHWRNGAADFGFGAFGQKERPAKGWMESLTVSLQEENAAFLRAQIKRAQANSLFATLLGVLETGKTEVLSVDHAYLLKDYPSLTLALAQQTLLRHSRTYELICRSCLLTYNEALKTVNGRLAGPPASARKALYAEVATSLRPEDVTALFDLFARDAETNRFLMDWSTRLFKQTDHGPEANELITRREIRMKGDRARLKNHSRAEELVENSTPGLTLVDEGARVVPVFDYRWPTVRGLLQDLTPSNTAADA